MPPRVDEVVTVPIVISNNSNAYAHDIVVDLLISDGTGRKVSLNDYFRENNIPIRRRVRMTPGEQWTISSVAMSSPNDSRELYASGTLKFKAKLQLEWKDVNGKQYRFINLGELKFTRIKDGDNIIETFWIDSTATYASINKNDRKKLDKYWGMDFDY